MEAFLGDPQCGLPAAKVVVNASGLGAGNFGDVSDELVEPILIRPPRPLQLITWVDGECIDIGSRPPTIPGSRETPHC
ncbi:hypothetical protein PGTUg99_034572 [Puccinia graminis f. sp. tritici]|uniref:Uncharacterized protein n=1 Tax=Puccinia graminis f. sp. tritici TaxID=56615 RepID=A0A5B0SPF8_PUCGR|nr:hypothetical protein PGTUg99_034572 [Puccinia graminis f. sp. tritici]